MTFQLTRNEICTSVQALVQRSYVQLCKPGKNGKIYYRNKYPRYSNYHVHDCCTCRLVAKSFQRVNADNNYNINSQGTEELHLVLIAGQPINEPIVQHGNTSVLQLTHMVTHLYYS